MSLFVCATLSSPLCLSTLCLSLSACVSFVHLTSVSVSDQFFVLCICCLFVCLWPFLHLSLLFLLLLLKTVFKDILPLVNNIKDLCSHVGMSQAIKIINPRPRTLPVQVTWSVKQTWISAKITTINSQEI